MAERKKIDTGTNVFLYFVAVTVHLTSATAGIAFCWSSPVSPKLENLDDNPLGVALSVDESSWLASLTSLGAVVGPFAGGYLGDSIGRKRSLTITAILSTLSFGLLAFGQYLYIYYVARFIGGEKLRRFIIGVFLVVYVEYL
ncbi:Major Facilitator Superfamily [Popillia japonica]|uniref:Major Facilitator Superfamily n=1 Tax=Popillia japonica TaxID=7064 RepID=A0AAW1M1W8_POPJA